MKSDTPGCRGTWEDVSTTRFTRLPDSRRLVRRVSDRPIAHSEPVSVFSRRARQRSSNVSRENANVLPRTRPVLPANGRRRTVRVYAGLSVPVPATRDKRVISDAAAGLKSKPVLVCVILFDVDDVIAGRANERGRFSACGYCPGHGLIRPPGRLVRGNVRSRAGPCLRLRFRGENVPRVCRFAGAKRAIETPVERSSRRAARFSPRPTFRRHLHFVCEK